MDSFPETMNTEQAAEFLLLHPNSLTRKAKKGEVPGRKIGKRWVFLKQHLIEHLKGGYSKSADSQVVDKTNGDTLLCQSINAGIPGGSTSTHRTAQEYDALLKLR